MSLFDIVLLIIIGGFTMFGFWFGFFHTLGSLFGTVFGAFFASRFYEPMSHWLVGITGWNENTSRVVMFIIAFFVINRLIGFAFWIVDKFFSIITHLPFIKWINRLLGFILGLLEGMITIGLVVFFVERVPLSEGIMESLSHSVVAPIASDIASILWPLLPSALQMLQSTIDYVGNTVL